MRHLNKLVLLLIVLVVALSACAPGATPTPQASGITFGLLLVGPYNDHGWSQAHYEAGQYVEKNVAGATMIYVDKVNPADRPGTTPAQLAEDLVSKGAKLVIFNSDDMKDSATEFAKAHPDVYVIMASGDQVWKEGKAFIELPNMTNIMGRMEYGKMMAGCAAALSTQTGQIGYLGPLINDETRRLASSVYLGAKYCWTKYLGKDAKDLKFKVTWIGFWFNIPRVTSDPTQVAYAVTKMDKFIADLAGGLTRWKGPLNLQDASVYPKDGEPATNQHIWYLPQLLEGMEGQSVSK